MMNFLKDWIIQFQNKFSVGGVETTIDRITGTVSQEGDTIMAAYLNEIQKNCIYQVNATRVIEGVLEIYDISIDGSEEFSPFNQTFLIDFGSTNTQVDSLLRFNGITYSLRFSDSVTNGDKAPSIGFIPKRAVVKLDVSNSKAIIIDDRTILQTLLELKANLNSPILTGIPTAPTGTAGSTTKQIATQEFATNQDFGVGQTWQNVKASRALGTTYTNTTGKSIMIFISVGGGNNGSGVNVFIDGVQTSNCGGAVIVGFSISFVVPNGSSYRMNSETTGVGITYWNELR